MRVQRDAMKYEVTSFNPFVLVTLEGDLNALEAPRFETGVLELLSGTPGAVAFDLNKLRYMNSSGIRAFVRIKRHLDQTSRHMILFGATNGVQGVIEMTRLDMLFDIRESL